MGNPIRPRRSSVRPRRGVPREPFPGEWSGGAPGTGVEGAGNRPIDEAQLEAALDRGTPPQLDRTEDQLSACRTNGPWGRHPGISIPQLRTGVACAGTLLHYEGARYRAPEQPDHQEPAARGKRHRSTDPGAETAHIGQCHPERPWTAVDDLGQASHGHPADASTEGPRSSRWPVTWRGPIRPDLAARFSPLRGGISPRLPPARITDAIGGSFPYCPAALQDLPVNKATRVGSRVLRLLNRTAGEGQPQEKGCRGQADEESAADPTEGQPRLSAQAQLPRSQRRENSSTKRFDRSGMLRNRNRSSACFDMELFDQLALPLKTSSPTTPNFSCITLELIVR